MDKYDRDPWHDAETVPLWFFILIAVVGVAVLLLGGCTQQSYHRTMFDSRGRITEEVKANLSSCLTKTDATDIIAASDTEKRVLMVGQFNQQPDPEAIKAFGAGAWRWLAAFFGLRVQP